MPPATAGNFLCRGEAMTMYCIILPIYICLSAFNLLILPIIMNIIMANQNLEKAKKKKNDEFYTQLGDINKEMQAYLDTTPTCSVTRLSCCHATTPNGATSPGSSPLTSSCSASSGSSAQAMPQMPRKRNTA